MTPEERLKSLLKEISGELKQEVKEQLEERDAKLQEKFGNLEEHIKSLGVPTVTSPAPVDITLPTAEGKEIKKRVYSGYSLDLQGKELSEMLERPDLSPYLKHQCAIKDQAFRDRFSTYMIDVIQAKFGNPEAQRNLWAASQAAKAMSEGSAGDGGYLVPDEYTAEILAFARLNSVALQECRIWPMTSDVKRIPAESANVAVAWNTESTAASATSPTITEVVLTAKKLDAYTSVSNELLQDSMVDIVSWLTSQFSEAIGQAIDSAVFSGTGVPCSGLCQGSPSCTNSVVMGTGLTNFSSITGSHLSEMIAKLAENRSAGAKFYMNKLIVHYLRIFADTATRYQWGTMSTADPNTVWGYPYRSVEVMPSTTAVSRAFVIYGNLRYFCIGRRLQSMTLEVDPYGRFLESDTRFKIVNRFGLASGLPAAFVRLITAAS